MSDPTPAMVEKTNVARSWHIDEEVILELFLLAVSLTFLIIGFNYPPQARFVPMVVLIPLCIGLGVETVLSARRPPKDEKQQIQATLMSAFWMLALLVLLYLGGLAWGLGLFILLYMRVYCGESWLVTIATTVVSGTGMYFFLTYLKLPMYWGIVIQAFRS